MVFSHRSLSSFREMTHLQELYGISSCIANLGKKAVMAKLKDNQNNFEREFVKRVLGLGNLYLGVTNAKTQLLKNNSTPNPNYSRGAEFFWLLFFIGRAF